MTSPPLTVRHLYGSLTEDAYRVRQIQAEHPKSIRLESLLTPGLLSLVAVLSGEQTIVSGAISMSLPASYMGIIALAEGLRWTAEKSQAHRFLLVDWSPSAQSRLAVHAKNAAAARMRSGFPPQIIPASSGLLSLMHQLANPPQLMACLSIWYQAKVMELAALCLFESEVMDEPAPVQDINTERVQRALFFLERDLVNPPTLEMLAQEVDCGAFHLSRLFASHVGKTMPEILREKRMALAAQLLRNSRQSVSDIALEVGYESFSAFSRGFTKEMGMPPTAYRTGDLPLSGASKSKSKASRGKQPPRVD